MRRIYVLDDIDRSILDFLYQGYAPKEIAHKMWKTRESVNKRLYNLRKYYGCKTTIQLVAMLHSES